MKEITIFICEDEEVRKLIVAEFLEAGKITYSNTLPAELREKIIKGIDELEMDEEIQKRV